MLRIIIPVFLFLLLQSEHLHAQTKENKTTFLLSGTVLGDWTGYLYLDYIGESGAIVKDSCLPKKGAFQFSGSISEPSMAFITGPENHRRIDNENATFLYLEAKEIKVTVKRNQFKKAKITGSVAQEEFIKYYTELQKINKRYQSRINSLKTLPNNRIDKDSAKSALAAKQLMEEQALQLTFSKAHPASFVSAYLLYLVLDRSYEELKPVFDAFSPLIKSSRFGRLAEEELGKKELVKIGALAPAFQSIDKEGKAVELKDYKGKYVLLEFWASWCIPCRQEGPNLISAYNTYKEKGFTILSFSLDEEKAKEAWLKAIDQDGLLWPQLSDLKGIKSEVVMKYNVGAIPANFLIDPAGKIIAVNLRGQELQNKLRELLKI